MNELEQLVIAYVRADKAVGEANLELAHFIRKPNASQIGIKRRSKVLKNCRVLWRQSHKTLLEYVRENYKNEL